MRRLVGQGWRPWLAQWIDSAPPQVQCLEITAEHFFGQSPEHSATLKRLSEHLPLFVHGLGLSLGTPGPLDEPTLSSFQRVAELANAAWVSEHVAFTRTSDVDLGHLNPVPLTASSLSTVVEHAVALRERCAKPLILENIATHLQPGGELSETQFLNALCERADCGLLLDVTNLHINAANHGYDPRAWLRELDPRRIVQLHIVGYSERAGRLEDHHGARLQPDLLELLADVLAYADVQAVILERDDPGASTAELAEELERLAEVCGAA